MSDEYGRAEWQTDEAAASAEAVRRIEAAIASGATVLDFRDLIAMTRLPDELAKAQGVREIYTGEARARRAIPDKFFVRRLTNISALAALTKLTALDLSDTPVSDLGLIVSLPFFASEQARYLSHDGTPAANPKVDRCLDRAQIGVVGKLLTYETIGA